MRSLIFAILLIALVTVTNAGREKRKSLREVKHGDHQHPHERQPKHDLVGHKPVGLSPHTVYKDEWLKMTRYSKAKSTDCKQKCGKHQICLIDQTSGKTDCFSRHNFREGRRLFRKFRNRDAKGLKKSIEHYSKHHQKHGDKHQHHKDQHNKSQHPLHNKVDHPHHDKTPHKKDHPQHKKVDHPPHNKNDHPTHDKKDHTHHKKVEHPQHKKDHPQHKKDHPHHKKDQLDQNSVGSHSPHAKPQPSDKQLQTAADHPKHTPVKDHHMKHTDHKEHKKPESGHQRKHEITDNHSGPHKKHEQALELHAKLTPTKINGHVVAATDKEETKAHQSKVSLHKTDVQKAAIKRLLEPHHKKRPQKQGKPHHGKGHHKGHKGHHHRGLKQHQIKQAKAAKYHVCTKDELHVMSKRLTDWFALLHARREENTHKRIPVLKHVHKCDCQETAVWALHQFDLNADYHLNHTELKHLETNQNEPCLKPFIDSCDHNLDSVLSRKEWCCCFAKTKPPCLQMKLNLHNQHLLGAFKPRCDENGYYKKEQCHTGTGYCWCVDLNGNEIAKTRAMGKAHCEKLNVMGYKKKN